MLCKASEVIPGFVKIAGHEKVPPGGIDVCHGLCLLKTPFERCSKSLCRQLPLLLPNNSGICVDQLINQRMRVKPSGRRMISDLQQTQVVQPAKIGLLTFGVQQAADCAEVGRLKHDGQANQ